MRNIGLITSGGDCGGLNAVIKGAALNAHANGTAALVIPNGYAGLYNLVNMEKLVVLTPERVDAVQASLAGSEAGHSRVKIAKIDDKGRYQRIKDGLAKHSIDGLVISGGDDTGSVIVDLSEHGIPCVHAPKTMDLDLQPYSVGGDSTVNRIAQFVRDLRTTAVTHNRVMVVEVFGRYAGHTAFRGGVAAEADCILLPEIPVDFRVVYEHLRERFTRRVRTSEVNAGTYMIVVAEGITEDSGRRITEESAEACAFGHQKLGGAGKYVAKRLGQLIKEDVEMEKFMKEQDMFVPGVYERPEIRSIVPSHLVRCGQSSACDVNFGMQAGSAAVHLLMEGKTGVTVVDVEGDVIRYMPTDSAIQQRHVDVSQVALFEEIGFCFGRQEVTYHPRFEQVADGTVPARHL
jgi:6-phosphofructokinase 1